MEVQAVGARTREGDNVHEMNCMLGKDVPAGGGVSSQVKF